AAASAKPEEVIEPLPEPPAEEPRNGASESAPESGRPAPENTVPAGLPDYVVADFPVPAGVEPHEVPLSGMAPLVAKIVEIEGPIHQDEVCRRVAGLFGKQRAGSRILAAVAGALAHLRDADAALSEEAGFWLTASQKAETPLRNRSGAPASLRKANLLPPMESAAPVGEVLRQNGAVSAKRLATA